MSMVVGVERRLPRTFWSWAQSHLGASLHNSQAQSTASHRGRCPGSCAPNLPTLDPHLLPPRQQGRSVRQRRT